MSDDRPRIFKCRGCGERGQVVEFSLVPRTYGQIVDDDGTATNDVMGDDDTAFWEGESTLGYACDNDRCRYWHGSLGLSHEVGKGWSVKEGWSIKTIARVVLDR